MLFGVVGVIYEVWLNVMIDILVFVFKSGNVVVLCGGLVVENSNCVLVEFV